MPVAVLVAVDVWEFEKVQVLEKVRAPTLDAVTVAGKMFHPTAETVEYEALASMNIVAVLVEVAVPVSVPVKVYAFVTVPYVAVTLLVAFTLPVPMK
jgi:CRISPR/Cas system CMR subunit Cmr4 (Cas7 group RAMP superfamily)